MYLIYFGDTSDNLNKPMPLINRIILASSAAAMLFGAVNLFGIEGMIASISTQFLS